MRARHLGAIAVGLALGAAAVVSWATTPDPISAAALPAHEPDIANGARLFLIGGCASCHAAKDAKGDERLKLGGGQRLETAFGTFVVPNISSSEEGIGGWTTAQFATAIVKGVSPAGEYFYPAFPYDSFARMKLDDVIDLKAYLDSLPPVARKNEPNDLIFPFSIRRGMAAWRWLYLSDAPVIDPDTLSPEALAGQYLVEGPGHCGACHTPRTVMGGMEADKWLAGAPGLDGPGKVPNLTPSKDGLEAWSAKDIAYFLESGFKPDYDTAGGAMVDVIRNLAKAPAEDREAIAAYLKAIPPLPNGY